ncbi:peptidoglycan binding protein CsiV [Vibrio sagamiensis]|uniref:Peptidoglycan-binding protein CsiV n=1 Tax=Vibrio sagamiensis NBRC 104589 TaxID=1219064 RepID=A0A511QEI8_9VIBR|nr:peptidoglycan binding protein CsiV [Vibrio sagamiensis]PNQ70255.1 hypothetical protein C1141_05150 [Vibrio agarivorans]GEM74872.1 hypothetical protein VSA01S_09840 [Vibrio sagamiensis NBRC 104589]
MRILIPLLLIFASMPSWAGRQFDIEVIIFKRAINTNNSNEAWPNELPSIELNQSGSLNDQNYRQSKGVNLLPRSAYRLNAQATALNRHTGFKVLKHVAWRQGDQGKANAPIFHIIGGRDFSNSYQANGQEANDYSSSMSIHDQADTSSPKPLFELDGTLQIYVQHYLFVNTVLDFREPITRSVIKERPLTSSKETSFGNNMAYRQETNTDKSKNIQVGNFNNVLSNTEEESFLQTIRMDQTRRMRSGEIHYLDNPFVGMLIQVRSVK